VEKMRQFKFDPSKSPKKNEEFLPPPAYTTLALPFNYGWHQNAQASVGVDEVTGEATMFHYEKRSKRPKVKYLRANEEHIPHTSPYHLPEDRATLDVIAKLTEALNERPIWTRRALGNHVGQERLPVPIIDALPHVAYQFKGGPFRDAVIKYGVDPRLNHKYRIYQTVFFKLHDEPSKGSLQPWRDARTNIPLSVNSVRVDSTTHLFDGKNFSLDGKVWQLCDVTDPLIFGIIHNAAIREVFDPHMDGFYNNGAWAKIHGIMKFKLIAIRNNIALTDADLEEATKVPDIVENNEKDSRHMNLPVPGILREKKGSEATPKTQDGFIREPGIRDRRKERPRLMRLDKALAIDTPKRSYVRKNPIPPQSRKGATVRRRKRKKFAEHVEGDVPQLIGSVDPAAWSRDNGKGKQREVTNKDEQPGEEKTEGQDEVEDGEAVEDDGEAIDDDEDEEEDDDGDETDESGHDEEADQRDNDSADEDGLREMDEEDYDSENTAVVDFAEQGPLQYQPQSRG